MWYVIKNISDSDPGEKSVDIQVPPESAWFSGHFPGNPILPGIAQLGMVFDAINQPDNQGFEIKEIRRVRFKQIIRPGDPLRLTIKPRENEAGVYDFRIQVDAELVCSGVMVVAFRSQADPISS